MLTPLEIENKKFQKQVMNGYNVDEVDDFLDELTLDYEKLYRENAELQDKVESSLETVNHYKNIEETLQNTLLVAQKTSEDLKNVAKQQADQIIAEAESNAKKHVEDLNKEIMFKTRELDDIKTQFEVYKAKMESLLISQLEIIKEINKDI